VVYTHFSTDLGLFTSKTNQIIQDPTGYIWIASSNGAMRFDGYTLVNYDMSDNLPENEVSRIIIDAKHKIWFVHPSGYLSRAFSDSITPYEYNDSIQNMLNYSEMLEPQSVYIGKNFIEFNILEKGRFHLNQDGILSSIWTVKDSAATIDLRKGECRYFVSSHQKRLRIFTNLTTYSVPMPVIEANEPVLVVSKGDTVLMSSQNKLYEIVKGSIRTFTFNNAIISLQIEQKGNLWIGFDSDGVMCFKNTDLNQSAFCRELDGNSISSVFRDQENSIWMSSRNNGLFYIPSEIFHQISTKQGLLDNNISKIDVSDRYLWAITGQKAIARIDFFDIKNYELSNPDFSIITDLLWYNSRLWVSFKNKLCYLENDNLVELISPKPQNDIQTRINKISAGLQGDIWLCKSNGFAGIKNQKIYFESSSEKKQNLNINAIWTDPNGTQWLACKNGLWKFENKSLYNFGIRNPILDKNANDITKDTKLKALWLSINGIGVVRIQNDSIWVYNQDDGLVSNSVNALYAYENDIWVASRDGISKIDINSNPNKPNIVNITVNDGLISNEVNDIVVNNKYVFVATNKGVGYFEHKRFKVSDNRPNTMITNILVNEESLPNRNKIYLDNDANNIRIEYLSIHFKSRGNVKYRYKLEGLDREWIYTTDLIASYPFLPSGDYVFIVEAANESGIWSKKTAQISIHVNSAYWAKWWFYTIISFFILGGLFALYRIRFRTRAQKEKIQREMNQYRQMALTRQMNPHFIFNSLNAIQLYILQNDTRLSNKFLTKFSKLIRLILENSQTTLISLEKELLTLNLYLELESLRFKEKMEYAIDIQDEIDTLGVKIPPMIIQPFVENAIWHGLMNKNDQTTGQLGIIFSIEDENIICRIEDNGVGRAKAKEINAEKNNTHKSMGTTITQDRIELINSIYKTNISVEYIDLFDDKQESKGTVVKITFTY